MIELSRDGYIRLGLEILERTPLTHFLSGIYEDKPHQFENDTRISEIYGYSEWVSTSSPTISIGWDWQISFICERLCCTRLGLPRSNIMILNNESKEVGPDETATYLAELIDTLEWQHKTNIAITWHRI